MEANRKSAFGASSLHPAEVTVCCRLIRLSCHAASCPRQSLSYFTVSWPEVQKKKELMLISVLIGHMKANRSTKSVPGAHLISGESRSVSQSLSIRTNFGDQHEGVTGLRRPINGSVYIY